MTPEKQIGREWQKIDRALCFRCGFTKTGPDTFGASFMHLMIFKHEMVVQVRVSAD